MAPMVRTRAFSLVELSIVLVILGLLTGGIIAGQSLISAAELRSVTVEYDRYRLALNGFRSQYNALPGDMIDATDYWGKDAAACNAHSGAAATPGTCNGNGNSTIEAAGAANATGEYFQAWKQLQLAGLIDGSYTGLAGASGVSHHNCPTNCPSGRLSNSGWGYIGWGASSGSTSIFDGNYDNPLVFGGVTNIEPSASILTPKEAWKIDAKTDDGNPALGVIVVRYRINCTNATAAVADSDNFDSVYNVTSSSKACALVFRPQY